MSDDVKVIKSNAEIFQNLVDTNLINSSKGHFRQFHERVQFKLDAARHFLNKLKELDKKAGSLVNSGILRFDVELNLDTFFYEVIGAFDAQSQEINVAFQLPLGERGVCTQSIINNMPNNSQTKKKLALIHGDTKGWFWQLREYRNHSAHRRIISFLITAQVGSGTGERAVYLFKDPLNPDKGRANMEVVPYCQESLTNMEQLIEEIYGLCIAELKTAQP
ncbi:MAG: hypothetical protein A2144_01515 [Chloroflexi bacterium RBG_16_50_9]|nr:MAG: hypothetical protein A2144_01515 [Chloroflexi bacterium RBG_16_50_9]